MSRDSESQPNPSLGPSRDPWGFGKLPAFTAFAGTRRGKATLGAAAAALLLAGSLSTASYMGADLASAAVNGAQSFAEMMKHRSPGARTGDQLTKTKSKYAVLSTAAEAPPKRAMLAAPSILTPIEVPPGAAPVELAQLAPVYAPPLFVGFYAPPGGGFGGPPGGGGWPPPDCCSGGVGPPGGGPGPPGGGPGPPGPPDVPPGIPEPSTWAMMLIGFAAAGLSLRGQRARAERASACA